MNKENTTLSTKDCELFVEREKALYKETHDLQNELTQINQAKKHTDVVSQRKAYINEAIAYRLKLLPEIKYMQTLSVGQWVQNGTTKPGKIIALRFDGDNPVVDVDWVKSQPTTATIPTQLKIVKEEDLTYSWKGSGFEKLTRKLEPVECEDIETIEGFKRDSQIDLNRAINFGQPTEFINKHKSRIAYCDRRIELLKSHGVVKKQLSLCEPIQTALNLEGDNRRAEQEKLLIKQAKRFTDYVISRDIPVDDILCDPRCHQREQLDSEVIADYINVWLSGETLPAIKVIQEGNDYWLYDGFHTLHSAKAAGIETIEAKVKEGTLRDAILASVGVNADHGLRRSNQTKRNAVMTLLKDEEWGLWSDNKISKLAHVSQPFVSKLRKNLTGQFPSETTKDDKQIITYNVLSEHEKIRTYKDKHGNINQMKTTNIGQPQKPHLNVSHFVKIGQIVQIRNEGRIDERLIGYKNSLAIVKARHEFFLDLEIWGKPIKNVAIEDINLKPDSLSIAFSEDFIRYLFDTFDSVSAFESHTIDRIKNLL